MLRSKRNYKNWAQAALNDNKKISFGFENRQHSDFIIFHSHNGFNTFLCSFFPPDSHRDHFRRISIVKMPSFCTSELSEKVQFPPQLSPTLHTLQKLSRERRNGKSMWKECLTSQLSILEPSFILFLRVLGFKNIRSCALRSWCV